MREMKRAVSEFCGSSVESCVSIQLENRIEVLIK